MHRLHGEGFDLRSVRYVHGVAPLPPLSQDPVEAMGRINDSLLYGGLATVNVEAADEQIEPIINLLPTAARPEYGQPFAQIFEAHDGDFHRMDLRLHSLARVQINNMATGRSFSAGEINPNVLRRSFFHAR